MVAPAVVVASVTATGRLTVPPFGVIIGAAAVCIAVEKIACDTGLSSIPAACVIARTVRPCVIAKGPVYAGELDVGVLPSSV